MSIQFQCCCGNLVQIEKAKLPLFSQCPFCFAQFHARTQEGETVIDVSPRGKMSARVVAEAVAP